MKRFWVTSACLLLYLLQLTACAAPSSMSTANPFIPTQVPSYTSETLPVTPVESAFAPENPTAAPSEEIVTPQTVTFETPDGAVITGELYGAGETAVVFSVMGNCKPGWKEFAELTAAEARDVMALTYVWRGCRASGFAEEEELQKFVDDTRGAINFVRERGAQKVILAGASLGGMASAKLALESQASGLVVVASPPSIPDWGFEIEASDLDTDIPKLFITAENDPTVPASATRQLHDLAAEPKEWQTYPENKHGTDVFETASGEAMQQRILEFILRIASTE